MKKIAIAVDNLGPSQLSYYLIRNVNFYIHKQVQFDIIAFYENFTAPCFPLNFAMMQLSEGWGYDGIVVATNLSTAHKMISFPANYKKLFYIWDLEWIRFPRFSFIDLYNIYGNKQITLLCRSEEHKRIVEDCWNVKVNGIVNNFDLKQLLSYTYE